MRVELTRRSSLIRKLTGAGLLAIALPAMVLSAGTASSPSFGTPMRVPGARGFEQGINVLPDGTLFVDEPAGLGSHSNAWRLDPGEPDFKKLVFPAPYSRLPGGGDSDVALNDDGRVYFLDLWVGSNSIARSENRGETWSFGSPFTTVPLTDRQWIAVGEHDQQTGQDTVYVVYQQFQPPNWVMFSRSRDGGMLWDYHRPAPFATGGVSGSTGKLVADGRYVAFSYDTSQGRMHVATSADAGETWDAKPVTLFNEADGNITGTALADQRLYTAWIRRDPPAIRFARSLDRGDSWYPATTLADVPGTAVFSWVAARDEKVAVVWYETATRAQRPDDVGADAEWRVMYTESTDEGATWTSPVSVANVVKSGFICTQGLNCSSGREVGDFLTVTIDPSGRSIVAYYDGIRDGAPCCGGMIVRQQ